MNLSNIKDCSKCENAIIFGDKSNMNVSCSSEDYDIQERFNKNGRHAAMYCKQYKCGKAKQGGLIEQEDALRFMLAGNSDFIMHSTKTDEDFRYALKMEESDSEDKKVFLVNTDSTEKKVYCGLLWFNQDTKSFEYKQGKNGNVSEKDRGIRSLLLVLNKLYNEETVGSLRLYHVGKCGHCNKVIIDAEESEIGIHRHCNNDIELSDIFGKNIND